MFPILAAGTALASVLAYPAQPAVQPRSQPLAQGGISADVVTVNGSGCPAGTSAIRTSPDGTSFKLVFSSYRASAGRGTEPTDFRKNCQISLHADVPPGQTYTLDRVTYRGRGHLKSGASATVRTSYYFQSEAQTAYQSQSLTGPLDGTWRVTAESDPATAVFAPCGEDRALQINSELRVSAGSSDIKRTTSDLQLDQAYDFRFRLADC